MRAVGGYFEFTMAVRPGPMILQGTYWGEERARDFDILVDNVKIATQHLGMTSRAPSSTSNIRCHPR